MNKITKKIAQDFEQRLIEVLRSALSADIKSIDVGRDLIIDSVNTYIDKFFCERKISTNMPDIDVTFIDKADLSKVRLDIINPQTGKFMELEDFMRYCGL